MLTTPDRKPIQKTTPKDSFQSYILLSNILHLPFAVFNFTERTETFKHNSFAIWTPGNFFFFCNFNQLFFNFTPFLIFFPDKTLDFCKVLLQNLLILDHRCSKKYFHLLVNQLRVIGSFLKKSYNFFIQAESYINFHCL